MSTVNTVRVATWNLWWRFGEFEARGRAIEQVLDAAAPDIICLQEVWATRDEDGVETSQLAHLAERFGWQVVATEPVWWNGRAFQNAIAARWPLTRVIDAALPGADGRPGHRRMVMAEVHTPWGDWPVVSTHLDHRFDASALRSAQLAALVEQVAAQRHTLPEYDPMMALPVILGGDLNAVPDAEEIRRLTGRQPVPVPGWVFSDVWEQVGEGPGATWRRENPHVATSAWPDRRIDYLMVSWPRPRPVGNPVVAQLIGDQPVDIDGEQIWPSDHAGVLAELIVPG